ADGGPSSGGIVLPAGSGDGAMGTTRGVPPLSGHRFRVKPHAYETPTAGHREEEQHCLPVPRESRADDDVPLAGSRFVSAMDEPKTGAKRDVSRGPGATTADSDAYPDARQSTRIRDRLARALGVAAVSRETKSRRVHALCLRQHRERGQSSE